MIKKFNDPDLRQDLELDSKIYLYFYSQGCGPCSNSTPKVEEFGNSTENIIYLIDSKEAKDLQKQLKISAYPSIVLVEKKQFVTGGMGEKEVLKVIDGESNK